MTATQRLNRAITDTRSLREVRPTLLRGAATAFLSLFVLGVANYPQGAVGVWLGLLTLVAGFVIVVALEFATNLLLADGRNAKEELRVLLPRVEELRANQAHLESRQAQGAQRQAACAEQLEWTQQALARMEAYHAGHTEVRGVLREQNAGIHVPLEAIFGAA